MCCFESHNRLIKIGLEDTFGSHNIQCWFVAICIRYGHVDDFRCEVEVVSHDIDEFVTGGVGGVIFERSGFVDSESLIVTIKEEDIGRSLRCQDLHIFAIGHSLGLSTIEWYDTLIDSRRAGSAISPELVETRARTISSQECPIDGHTIEPESCTRLFESISYTVAKDSEAANIISQSLDDIHSSIGTWIDKEIKIVSAKDTDVLDIRGK